MNYMGELLKALEARLPELEWKLSHTNEIIPSSLLPRGLFRSRIEATGAACIDEIKKDIHALASQDNERSAHYLATRIQQKINVLVALCMQPNKPQKLKEQNVNMVKKISSRQQWITAMEHEVEALQQQQKSLLKTLEHVRHRVDTESELNLLKELGEVERRLTLAKENLQRAIS